MARQSKSITAADLMRQLEGDPEWVRKRDERERRHRDHVRMLADSEAPLVADLNAAGFAVKSIHELILSPNSVQVAIPLLTEHLQRDYDKSIREGIFRAFGIRDARELVGDLLISEFRQQEDENMRLVIVEALSQMYDLADVIHLDGIQEFKDLFEKSTDQVTPDAECRGEDGLFETSMNFDLDNVRPFLERLARLVPSGFRQSDIDRVVSFVASTSANQERDMRVELIIDGTATPLIVRVFMDDIDAPDLYFITTQKLVTKIEDEYDAFCEETGI